ncbi:member of the syntaxin family of t-snares [Scheffersomyces coipomensis]|uniref:member of the syntaxin family of t-snares n=1 Tax=Scheffersomyces coipomensis TaxID=1788519 RepID=UPI00315CC642
MDPFNEVKEDAWSTVGTLENILSTKIITPDTILDFNNNYQELLEIFEDLKQAHKIGEQQPDKFHLSNQDIDNRKLILKELDGKIKDIQIQWNHIQNNSFDSRSSTPLMNRKPRDVTTMSNRISQDGDSSNPENPFNDSISNLDNGLNQFQQQQLIDEQDLQLDSIHDTMRNLNQQAMMMGNELEEQGIMLDELDHEIDNVSSKVQRGLKRINHVLEKNRETASNWCIGILTVALCVLLILVIAL